MKNLSNLKTGDIVLFSGRCKVARMIQILTLCKWSHIGMIIRDEKTDDVLVYESTHNDRVEGYYTGKKIKGVHAVQFKDRLEGYNGDIAVMSLDYASLDIDSFNQFRKESEGVLFEQNYHEAFLSMFKWINNVGDFSTRFCSEHVGGCYKALGLLCDYYPVHKLTPADFYRGRLMLESGMLSAPMVYKKVSKWYN